MKINTIKFLTELSDKKRVREILPVKKLISSNNIDVLASFIIYGFGLLATLISDLYVARQFSASNISEYAFLKSCIFILGTLCLLGYDQLLVRDPGLIIRILKTFLIQSFLISLVSALLIHFIKDYDSLKTLLIFFCIYSASLLTYFAAAARANHHLWKSQFYSNFWRILILILLVLFIDFGALTIFIIGLFCNCILAYFVRGFTSEKKPLTNHPAITESQSRRMGLAFVFHNTTLILAIYGEQFFINLNGDNVTSSHLFRYTAIFTPIAIAINGFLGFYYGPKIRKQSNMTTKKYISFTKNNLVIGFFNTLVSVIAGLSFFTFNPTKFDGIDIPLVCSLSLMCITRGVYTSSSVCLGVFGSTEVLRFTAFLSLLCTLFYILVIYLILNFFSGIAAARLISLSTLLNWGIRFVVYHHYSIKSIKEHTLVKAKIKEFNA